ncbi:hypothetical protein ACIGEZ_14370 [Streptomyces sp. NPDC085481]|uniref:hypothetical protein n=1 Tax=Streptomyces sp. NPDC085481 TaxID=3365727 RepID=UPI0037D51828
MSEKPSVSDEEWAEFVEAAQEQGLGTKAQDRALRKARPKRQPKPPRSPKRQEPAGWRTGPAWQEMNGRAHRRRRAKGIVGITLAATLAVIALRPQLLTDHLPEGVTSALPSSWTDHPQDTTPLAAETARPTEAPEYVDPDRPTLKEPFNGSPAVRWADGAAGIELPEAKATGWMSKAEVAAALKRSREFLVAANLDPAVLRGARPTAALKMIDPKQPGLEGVERSLAKPSEKDDPKQLFSRFDPAEVRQVGTAVKTRGRMTVEKGEKAGEVLIRTDYTFVYPVVKSRPGSTEVARTIVRREVDFLLLDPDRYRMTRGKLWLFHWNYSAGNTPCEGPEDGFYHPEFQEDLVRDPGSDTGPAVDPYDRSKPLDDLPQECGTVSRS